MKKLLFILFTLFMMSAKVFADGLTATLQQGDKMTPFYGVDAFKNAYAAADSGAVITLSAGTFNIVNSIEKTMKIVGNFGLDANSVERTILSSLSINANKVTIDGIFFSGDVSLGNICDCKISHSWIEGTLKYAYTESWHTNTVVDQCVIKKESANKQGVDYKIYNSTINEFTELNNNSNIAYIKNCVIYKFTYNHISSSGGVICLPEAPIAVYINNVLGVDVSDYYYYNSGRKDCYCNVRLQSPSEFYYNIFPIYRFVPSGSYYSGNNASITFSSDCSYGENNTASWSSCLTSSQYPSTPKNPGYGQDGTLRGPQGGTGFSLYPSIPRIVSKEISPYSDREGKIKVKITVESK